MDYAKLQHDELGESVWEVMNNKGGAQNRERQ